MKKRWPNGGPTCILCNHDKVYWIKSVKRYKCPKCGKQFSLTQGTIFHDSKISLSKWFMMVYDYVSSPCGVQASVIANDYGISYKSAWFAHIRITELLKIDTNDLDFSADGVYEIDGVGIGPDLNLANKKRKSQFPKGMRGYPHHPTITAILKRGSFLCGKTMKPYPGKEGVNEFVLKHLPTQSTVYTDTGKDYASFKKYFETYKAFKHNKKDYGGGKQHSNTVEGCFREFRRLESTHKHISFKYAQRYFDEFSFRYTYRSIHKLSDIECFDKAMDNVNRQVSLEELKREAAEEYERIKPSIKLKVSQDKKKF